MTERARHRRMAMKWLRDAAVSERIGEHIAAHMFREIAATEFRKAHWAAPFPELNDAQ